MAKIALPKPPLTDGVVALRTWRKDDVPAVVAACQDPEMPRWMPIPWPYSERDAREWIATHHERRASGRGAEFAVVDADGGEVLGSVGLTEINWAHKRAVIGYWVIKKARRRGVATRAVRLLSHWAFDSLGLARIELLTYVGNLASDGVARKAGFTREGLVRSYQEAGGKRVDMNMFSLLAKDSRVGSEQTLYRPERHRPQANDPGVGSGQS